MITPMITPKNFLCKRCGECCKAYTVKLAGCDIKKIKKAGYSKEHFAVRDDFDIKRGRYALRRIDERCIFLTEKNNKSFCMIYKHRPKICRSYPFNETDSVESCKPELKI